ncbi:MAG: YdcF family protein [Planctomycetaceae bacterium]|nr:YdcF family protein [Planctomycetaceae bacterium]
MALVVALAAGAWVERATLLRGAARWLDVGEAPQAADYIMLLNGDESTRPFAAAALMKEHRARDVLIAEVRATPQVIDGVQPPTHEINREVLIQRGVPEGKIRILPGQAATTYDEAKALSDFLDKHPGVRVMVLTSDYHTRRSRWVFDRALGDHAGRMAMVSATTDEFDMDRWWLDEHGMPTVAAEYFKLAFYTAYYGHLGHWAVAMAGLAVAIRWARRRVPKCDPAGYRDCSSR